MRLDNARRSCVLESVPVCGSAHTGIHCFFARTKNDDLLRFPGPRTTESEPRLTCASLSRIADHLTKRVEERACEGVLAFAKASNRPGAESFYVSIPATIAYCFFQISSGWLGGSSAGFSPAKRTLDACGKSKLGHGWLRQNAATSHARQREH